MKFLLAVFLVALPQIFGDDLTPLQVCVNDADQLKAQIMSTDSLEYGIDTESSILEKFLKSSTYNFDIDFYYSTFQPLLLKLGDNHSDRLQDYYMNIISELSALAAEFKNFEGHQVSQIDQINQADGDLKKGKARYLTFAENAKVSCATLKKFFDEVAETEKVFVKKLDTAENAEEMTIWLIDHPKLNFDQLRANMQTIYKNTENGSLASRVNVYTDALGGLVQKKIDAVKPRFIDGLWAASQKVGAIKSRVSQAIGGKNLA